MNHQVKENMARDVDIYIVGLGIVHVQHITREVDEVLRRSNEILYVEVGDEIDAYLQNTCPKVTNLHKAAYVEGVERLKAYDIMSAMVLDAALNHPPVTLALYGHPLVFAYPPFQILQAAPLLGLCVRIIPGISAMDCLFVDLKLDPSHGLQVYEATDLVLRRRPLQRDVPCLIWQIGALESPFYSAARSKPERFSRFKDHLLQYYPAEHKAVAIFSSTRSGVESNRLAFTVGEVGSQSSRIHQGMTLYIPPVETRSVKDEELVTQMGTPAHTARISHPILDSAAPEAQPTSNSMEVVGKLVNEGTMGSALFAYRMNRSAEMPLVPAPGDRTWMNITDQKFATGCLPFVLANKSGWFILSKHKLRITWTGGQEVRDLNIEVLQGEFPCPAVSVFGYGILTWRLPYLFRTLPGYNLIIRGPVNSPKDGIYPLEAIIATDVAHTSFPMNWKMTRPVYRVTFEVGEPIGMLVPQKRGELEAFYPKLQNMDGPAYETDKQDWQKHYFEAVSSTRNVMTEQHLQSRLRDFVEWRTE